MDNSKQNVFSNVIWRFAERCGAQVVSFIVSIVLARILAPEAYGTIALITVFTNILQVFVDSGLGNALIQKKDADDLDFSTVFFANIAVCLFLYVGVFLCAPAIASFYNDNSLVAIVRVLSLTIVISGVKNVQQAYVSKKLIFKKFFFATLAGTVGAAVVGIVMAQKGFGVWALVAQQLFNLTVDTIVLWMTVKWRPKLMFSFKRLKKLFSYGWKLLVSALLDTTYENVRQLVIGKIYSSADLAFYNKGKQFPNLIVTNINTSIDSVLLPTMSNEQDNKVRVRDMTRRAIKTSIFIMAPLMMGLAFTSKNIVTLLLTEKWLECVPYLCVFCVTFMFYPIHTANLNAIKAMGRSDLFLKMEIVKKIVGVVLLVATMYISPMAMACSLLVSGFLGQIINSWPNKKLLGYSYIEQIKDILPSILLAVFMGVIVYLVGMLKLHTIASLALQVVVGGVIYIVGAKILRIDSFYYLLELLRNIIKKSRKE